jgi:UDP-N-acetylmuramate dehydrogenase
MSTRMHTASHLHIQENVPLAPHTTIGIGGPARYYLRATDVDEVRAGLDFARTRSVPLFILGGGSNLLISDDGFPGLVLRMDLRGIWPDEHKHDHVLVRVAAGEHWDSITAFAASKGWAGIECLSGIPGSTGATPIQNVGAYGQEVSQTIESVEAYDREVRRVVSLSNDQCQFAYRSSIFKTSHRDRYVVLSATFRLKPGAPAAVKYPELRRYVEDHRVDPHNLLAIRDAVIAIRKTKGMVIDPADPDTRSDGSFFTNPIVPPHDFEAFKHRAASVVPAGTNIPSYPAEEGHFKLSAAWLIENAGFTKGFTHGAVGLSSKHCLAVINRGNGTAREIIELVDMIRGGVFDKFGVRLEPEPDFIGIPR